MHSRLSVSRTARLFGVPMMPTNMSTPLSINAATTQRRLCAVVLVVTNVGAQRVPGQQALLDSRTLRYSSNPSSPDRTRRQGCRQRHCRADLLDGARDGLLDS